jgi:hypothetical protein
MGGSCEGEMKLRVLKDAENNLTSSLAKPLNNETSRFKRCGKQLNQLAS